MTRPLNRNIERKCRECGDIFLTTKSNYKKVFCSSKCNYKHQNGKTAEIVRKAKEIVKEYEGKD